MKKTEIKKSQVWLVMTGFSCNSNCVMCSTKPKAKIFSDRPREDVVNDLKMGRELGYEEVDLTGGEPTIRPDIVDLIKVAKGLEYKKIGFNTNARMLSYKDFCEKIIKSGVNRITFTLNGHNKKLVDAIARTPGAFDQAISGIKNVLNYPQLELAANTVVSRMNYQYLKEIGEFINELGIGSWHLLDLIPDGNAKGLYKNLCVKAVQLSDALNNLGDTISKFSSVMFFDFPLCFFSQEMLKNPQNIFITAKGRMEITKQVGYNPERFKESQGGSYEDIHKKRIESCRRCKFSDACAGIWEDYLDLYGEKEFVNLARKNGCADPAGEEVHAYLQIGSMCNQKCLFCNRPPTTEGRESQAQNTNIIKNKLDELSKNRKIKRIIFTGGEPTINSNLLELISYAKSRGFKVEIQTNGTILSEKKLQELKHGGLDIINFALHSHKEAISNKLRGVKFGYKKILENIGIAKKIGFEIHAIHVINAFNFKDLPAFIDFIHKIKLDDLYLNLSIVVPEGWAWENKEVIPRMRDIKPYLQGAMKKCRDYGIKFDVSEIVPLCIMQGFENHAVSTIFKLSNMKIMDDYYTGQRILDFDNPSAEYAQKAPQCEKCTFDKICAGFYPRLKEIYGTEDFVPRCDDPALIFKELNSQKKLLEGFKDKKIEVFHHKKSRSPEILYVNLDEKCNQNCVFCVVKGSNKNKFGSMGKEEAKKIIKKFIENGGKTIIFTGGEPTLREDLPELIEYTEQFDNLGGISIITNGVRLADKDYCKKIINADNKNKLGFSVSLHSRKESVSDLLTKSAGGFKKTIEGIKNAVHSKRSVSIYHVITSKNYKDLLGFSGFLTKNFPTVKDINLAYPFPQGNAILNDWINVKMNLLRPYLKESLRFLSRKGYRVVIAACGQFPLCAIPGFEEKVIQPLNYSEENIFGVIGEKAFHEFEMATDEWVEQYKGKNEKCAKCILNNICQGFWKKYIELFGFAGIKTVNEENFEGNKVILKNKEDIKKLAQKINKEKLNLIVLKNDYSKEVIDFIKTNQILAVVVCQKKVIYPK